MARNRSSFARRRAWLAMLALLALLGAACGGDDDDVVAGGDSSDESDNSDDNSDESDESDESTDESDESTDESDESTDESDDGDDGGSGDDPFCDVQTDIDEVFSMIEDDEEDPDVIADALDEVVSTLEDAQDDAPDEIADDFDTLVDLYTEVRDGFEDSGSDLDAFSDEADAIFEENSDSVFAVFEWFAENCEGGFVGDDGGDDAASGEGGFATVSDSDIADLEPGASAPGPDEAFDALWEECADGDLAACDDLYFQTPIDSLYEAFGATCGATNLDGTTTGFCAEGDVDGGVSGDDGGASGEVDGLTDVTGNESSFDLDGNTPAPGPDPALDALWESCGGGDDAACDELWTQTPFGSLYELYAYTCGGRDPSNESGVPCAG